MLPTWRVLGMGRHDLGKGNCGEWDRSKYIWGLGLLLGGEGTETYYTSDGG